jgi:nucleoside-diphosphate-sugar epimerase
MDLLVSRTLPLINDRWHRVMYFGSVDQKLDFTTVPDTAAFTAAVAADSNPTPKILRIAGDSFNSKDLAAVVSKVHNKEYKTMWIGSVGFLRTMIPILRFLIGGADTKLLPPWQGIQYLENMVSGDGMLEDLDNSRYPELVWTDLEQALREVRTQNSPRKED